VSMARWTGINEEKRKAGVITLCVTLEANQPVGLISF